MGLGIARRLKGVWKLVTGRAYTPAPNVGLAPLRAEGRALVAWYGGRLLPGAMGFVRHAGGAVAHLAVNAPEGAPVLVLAEATFPFAGTVWLRDAAGELIAEAPMPADPRGIVGLVAPRGGALSFGASERSTAWRGADAFVLGQGLDLARLVPRVPLAADAAWTRHYGPVPAHDVAGQVREAAFRSLTATCAVDWIEGLKLGLEPGNELCRAIALSGLYEPELMVALRPHLRPGGVFVDAGANLGVFTLFAAARVGPAGRVLAFEPSGREFAQLERNVALNGLGQVSLHRAALGEAAGEAELRVAEEGHAGHNTLGSGFAYDVAEAARERVAVVRLDDALAGMERCDAIKLDIEGAELRALRGAAETLARLRPVLAVEMSGASLAANGASVAEVMRFLDAAGYDAFDIDPATGGLRRDCRVEPDVSKNIMALPR